MIVCFKVECLVNYTVGTLAQCAGLIICPRLDSPISRERDCKFQSKNAKSGQWDIG
jgi:hypothetical protein